MHKMGGLQERDRERSEIEFLKHYVFWNSRLLKRKGKKLFS